VLIVKKAPGVKSLLKRLYCHFDDYSLRTAYESSGSQKNKRKQRCFIETDVLERIFMTEHITDVAIIALANSRTNLDSIHAQAPNGLRVRFCSFDTFHKNSFL
jgi:hypothetical protein